MSPSQYNSDELVPPSFVTEEFIRKLVVNAEKDEEAELTSFDVKPGSSAGDHYASIMFKITVSYVSRGKSVSGRRMLLKTMPEEDGQKKKMLKDMPLFRNEIKMYSETLPAMEKILERFGEKPFWPKILYHSRDPDVIVFEDLTQEGFGMNYKLLNFEKIDLILEKIAKFHALSMVLAESDQKELVSYKNDAIFQNMKPMFEVMTKKINLLASYVKTWPGFEEIGEKVDGLQSTIFDKYVASLTNPNTWGFNVLNHGDFHIRNMMFHKDDQGNLDDVKFLDFQISTYMSPGYDLIYMFNAIGAADIRERRQEVIRKYHQFLARSLKLYEFPGKVPSVVDIHVEILRMYNIDILQVLCFNPVLRIDLTGIELGELFNTEEENPMNVAIRKLFQDPSYIADLKKVLLEMDNLGAFD